MILQVGELPVASSFSVVGVARAMGRTLDGTATSFSTKEVWGKRGELKLLIPIPDILQENHTKHNAKFFFGMQSEVAKKQNERNFRTNK